MKNQRAWFIHDCKKNGKTLEECTDSEVAFYEITEESWRAVK